MQNTAIIWVLATTGVLILVAAMAATGFSLNWVFYVTVTGQAMVVYMVYKVLTDPYSTEKTFEDFYEDYSMDGEE